MTAETFTQSEALVPEQSRKGFGGESGNPDEHLYHYVQGEVTVHGAKSRYTLTVPTELATSEITAYLNGFGAFKKTMRGIRNETSAQGTAALSMAPIRRSNRSRSDDINDPTTLHVDTFAAIVDDLPNNKQLRDVPNGDRLSFNKVNLAPHSYGGDAAVKYGLEHPENVSNIVLIKSVGMENPNALRFVPRLPGFFAHELLPFFKHAGGDFSYIDGKRALVHFLGDPFQTIGEMKACMSVDNRQHLPTLRAHKIGLAILTGAKDNLIPAGPIEEVAMHLVDHYEKMDTDHLGPQKQPQKVAAAVIRAVQSLENQKAVAMHRGSYPDLTAIAD